MVKKEMKDIPTLGEETDELKTEVPVQKEIKEPKQEGNLQLVTNEQLIQFKLDNLGLQVQELTSQVKALVEILRKKK